jgi:subtilisin family serine protease
MRYLFILFGLIAVISGFYLIPSEDFQSLQLTQVFAQSENKKFENATITQSSETNSFTKLKNNQSQESQKTKSSLSNGTTNDSANKDAETPKGKSSQHTKIHPSVTAILENANPNVKAKLYGAEMEDDQLFVYLHLKEKSGKPLGLEIFSQYKNTIFTKLNYGEMQSLANSEAVKKITLPDYAEFYGHAKSEGIEFSGADAFHNAGINGTGITVAIIDDSFITNNTEISGNIVNQTFYPPCLDMGCNFSDGDSHGTAVGEIIVDMAPGVSLELYTIKERLGFLNATDDAISKNVDIITASLGFPFLGGDPFYRDGKSEVAQKVNQANSTGTLFTVAAGNDGDSHWKGKYVIKTLDTLTGNFADHMVNGTPTDPPVSYESVMMFNSSATGNMQACLPVTVGTSTFDIFWSDWTNRTNDYDAFLYDSTMSTIKAASQGWQNGSFEPWEFFSDPEFQNDGCIVIASDISSEDHLFHIFVGNNNTLNIPINHTSRLGSIDTPADAAGAFTIGAVNFATTPTTYSDDFLEPFSSQGPTDDGRLKPEICGPDETLTHQTTLAGGTTFLGTSAATPHVAAAAALLLEQNPTLDVNALKQKLISDARNGTFSTDNKCGSDSGSLNLVLDSCSPPQNGNWTVYSSCEMTGNATINGGSLIVENNSVLTIPDGVTLDIDFVNHNLTVKFGSGILIKSGGTIS